MVSLLLDDYLKKRLCLEDIGDFVDCWGQSIVGNLENVVQDAAEHVGRLFEVS